MTKLLGTGLELSDGTSFSTGSPELFQARPQVDSTTIITLQRYLGNQLRINGQTIDPGAGGIALDVADNLITAAGTNAGAAPAVSTLYHGYVSNANSSYAPLDSRLSATAPAGLINGAPYLATTGNGQYWKYWGSVYVSAAGTFIDSETQRFLTSYYNRQLKPITLKPGYNDNGAHTTFTLPTTGANPTRLNAGTGSKGELCVPYGGLTFSLSIAGTCYNEAGAVCVILGVTDFDLLPAGGGVGHCGAHLWAPDALHAGTPAQTAVVALATGYHTIDFVGDNDSGGAPNVVFYADLNRGGLNLPVDLPMTILTAELYL